PSGANSSESHAQGGSSMNFRQRMIWESLRCTCSFVDHVRLTLSAGSAKTCLRRGDAAKSSPMQCWPRRPMRGPNSCSSSVVLTIRGGLRCFTKTAPSNSFLTNFGDGKETEPTSAAHGPRLRDLRARDALSHDDARGAAPTFLRRF